MPTAKVAPTMQWTVAVIKPDAVDAGVAESIVQAWEESGLSIVRSDRVLLTKEKAEEFCWGQRSNPNFGVMTDFMCSGTCEAYLLSGVNAVEVWKKLMGPEDSDVARQKAPGSIRAMYGTNAIYNAVHGSENANAVQSEIRFFFPDVVVDIMPVTSLQNWETLKKSVLPGLSMALTEMCKVKPREPYLWLSNWMWGKTDAEGRTRQLQVEGGEGKAQLTFGEPLRLTGAEGEKEIIAFQQTGEVVALDNEGDDVAPFPENVLEGHAIKLDITVNELGRPNHLNIPGTWNMRKVPNVPVYGMAQPSADGIHNTLYNMLGQNARVIWLNLRDEPFVFVTGRSFCLRNQDELNVDIDFLLGMDKPTLESMERRLVDDVVDSASQFGTRVQYFNQTEVTKNEISYCKEVDYTNTCTVRDVYADALSKELNVSYCRIPLQSEVAPDPKEFDQITQALKDIDGKTAVCVNCRDGNNRTTMGMICATLVLHAKHGLVGSRDLPSEPVPQLPHHDYKHGDYQCILNLVKSLDRGEEIRRQVDDAIDQCGHLFNLREQISRCVQDADAIGAHDTRAAVEQAQTLRRSAFRYLETYWWLIVYNAYLQQQVVSGFNRTFSSWFKDRAGIKRMLTKAVLV